MKVVVVKKRVKGSSQLGESNPVVVPMEGVEAIIQSKEAAEAKVQELQVILQNAYMELESANADIAKYKSELKQRDEERHQLLSRIQELKTRGSHASAAPAPASATSCGGCKSATKSGMRDEVRRRVPVRCVYIRPF